MGKPSNDATNAYIFFNCDEWKSFSSMNIRYNDTVYKGSRDSRRLLWQKIKDELAAGAIQINENDMTKVRAAILSGDPTEANSLITYGNIVKMTIL